MAFKNIWHTFLKNVILVIFLVIIIFYIIQCELYQYNSPNFKLNILILISIILTYYILYKLFYKIELRNPIKFKFTLFTFSILIYLIYGLYARTVPVSDYEVLINGAKEMINGNFSNLSFDKTNYFYFYNFQTGYVVYIALVMKLFWQKLVFIKFIEIVVMSCTNILIYNIISNLYSSKSGIIGSLIYTTLLFNIAGSSIINNQHIATFLTVLSLWFFIKNKFSTYIVSGLIIGFAIILRPSIIVVAISYILFILWKLLKSNFKQVKRFALILSILLVSIFGLIKLFDFVMVRTKTVPISAVNGKLTYFKFILGLKGNSLYNFYTESAEKNQVYFDLEYLDFDYQKYNSQCKEHIINLYRNNPRTILDFISEKMIIFCGSEDNQIEFAGNNLQKGVLRKFMSYYGYAQYVLILILALSYSILFLFKENKIEYNDKEENFSNLLLIIFILFFIAHIFIEVQSRYRYEQYLVLSIIAAPIMSIIFDRLNFLLEKSKTIKINLNKDKV